MRCQCKPLALERPKTYCAGTDGFEHQAAQAVTIIAVIQCENFLKNATRIIQIPQGSALLPIQSRRLSGACF